jgi:hypothetical protein
VEVPPLTRRQALALGAAAGLSSPLVPDVASAWLRRARAPRGFSLAVPAAEFGARGRTGVLRAPARFDLLGVSGAGRAGGLEVRVRSSSRRWGPWVALGAGHHAPDAGSGAQASEPVWVGDADELQLRCARRPRAGMEVHMVGVPAVAKRLGAAAARAAAASPATDGTPVIIPRSHWGGDAVRPRAAPVYGDVQVAFVHHTVNANGYRPEDSAGIVLAIAKYHRDVNGWNDLGYQFLVDRYGQIFEGRAGGVDQAVVGAHAQGYNRHSTGIANIGTFEAGGQTAAAVEAMARLIAWKLTLHGAPVSGQVVLESDGGKLNRHRAGTPVTLERICGHRDGDATVCPGRALYAQLPELRERAAALVPVASPASAGLAMAPPAAIVRYGDPLGLQGTVTGADGAPVAGQAVAVEKQGPEGWVTMASTSTAAVGTWVAQVPWRRGGLIRARALIAGATVLTAPAHVDCEPLLAVRRATARVRAGHTLTVSGNVRPAVPVAVSVARQGSDGRFRRVAVVTVAPSQPAFRAAVALRRPGLYRLTPRALAGPATVTGPSMLVRAVRGR